MIKFYLYVLLEYFYYLLLGNKKVTQKTISKIERQKDKELSDNIIFHIHEWAGYPFEREKVIKKTNNKFTCGLRYSIERINDYIGKYKIEKILTLSDYTAEYMDKLKSADFFKEDINVIPVTNKSMDFSGYSYIAHKIVSTKQNKLVFFSNTSVNEIKCDFIDDYIEIFIRNKNLGLLGISYSSKIYQTLIKDNYTPHVQSFFFLTTTEILEKIIEKNKGYFPGEKNNYKLSIIRFGEAKLSTIVQELGLDIGVITEKGELLILPLKKEEAINLVKGDYRLFVENPNKINKIL
ncbi:MAG: hypothetical protein Q3983_08130 [Capnocytophaga sp.]|nr:hypothetical protein [Capnocytophaga sp.]